jgi:Flp pilus assembly protein TadD
MWTYVRYVEQPRFKQYLLVLLSFAMGLMAKPMLVSLPFVLLLMDYWPLGRLQFGQSSRESNPEIQQSSALRLVLEKVPFLALTAVSSLVTFFAQQKWGLVQPLEVIPLQLRIANTFISYVSYIGKMIWPHPLTVLYPYPVTLPVWKVAGSILLLVCISLVVLSTVRRRPYLAVGWFWYIGTLVPVVGLVQVGVQAMAERYTYVPLIGIFIVIAWGVPEFVMRRRFGERVLGTVAAVVLSILMVTTWLQVRHWANSITLFEHALKVDADNCAVRNSLADVLKAQGRTDEAMSHYTEVLRQAPDYAIAHNNLAGLLAAQGKTDGAISHYTKALQIKPDFAAAHNNLGGLLGKQGKTAEAISHLTEAVRIKPHFAEAHCNLGGLLGKQGSIAEAISHLTEALRIKPHFAEAHSSLGNLLGKQGKTTEAISHLTEVLRIKPDHAEAHNDLGVALSRQGRLREAIPHFREALRIKPDYPMASNNLKHALAAIEKLRQNK